MKKQQGTVSAMRWSQAVLGFVVMVGGGAGCQIVLGMGDWVDVGSGTGGSGGTTGSEGVAGMTGGTGGMTVTACEPGAKVACYDGPAETEGKGNCKGGMATCKEDGMSHGPCEGQVLPGAEVPDVIGDEACDGYAPGEPVWWSAFGGTGSEQSDDMATDDAGNIFICGEFDGMLQFGDNAPLVSQGGKDIFLVKLSPEGVPIWSHRFGEGQDQTGCRVAVDRAGGVYLVGTWPGQISFGGMLLQGGQARAVRFDSDGKHVWSRAAADFWPPQDVRLAASLHNGDLVISGPFTGKLGLGGATVNSTTGSDVYVLHLGKESGAFQWGVNWPDTQTAGDGDDAPIGLSVSADDKIGVLATIRHGVVVDGDQGQDLVEAQYKHPFVVAQYDSTGAVGWHQLFEYEQSDGFDEPVQLAPAAAEGFLLTVIHSGLNPGGIAVSTMSSMDGTGAPYLDLNIDLPISDMRFASNGTGDILVGLHVQTVTSFSGEVLGPAAGGGGLANAILGIGRTDPAKNWGRSLGGQLAATDTQGIPAVAPAPDGGLVTAVTFNTKVVFGGKALSSAGGDDIAVARFAP